MGYQNISPTSHLPPPMLAIVGPTASGKSAMALKLAQKYNGEIICADSRTIYKGMDIGTAKPSLEDQKLIPHHCLDIVNPDQIFSAADFKNVAIKATKEIKQQGRLPILVGGSGLYMDAVLYDFVFENKKDLGLESKDLEQLQQISKNMNLKPTENIFQNSRHLRGFIERGGKIGLRKHQSDALIIGLQVDRDELNKRIEIRVDDMFSNGLVEETKDLLEKWGKDAASLQTPGYKPVIAYINGDVSLNEAKKLFIRNDKQLAKRQLTWFKRNKDIHWVSSLEEAEQVINEDLLQ